MNKNLIKAVRRQLASENKQEFRDTLSDVARHGADVGWHGFTYYSETCAFWRKNKEEIISLLYEDSENFGAGILEMVKGFNCLNGLYSVDEIGAVIYGGEENTDIENALAWYALESVAFAMENEEEEEEE